MTKGEGPIDKWRLYNNEKVIPNFKIYYTETNWLPRVISITIIQLLRVLILSRVCFVSLSILASVYHAHAIFQIWWEVKTRLVAFQRHEVALDIWDVHEVFLPALIPEEAVAPRPAEVRHRARLHLALRTRGAYYLVLSIVCAQLWIHFCGTMVSLEFSSYTSPIFSAHFSLMQHFKDILCSILLQHTITLFVFQLHKPQTHKGVLCPVVCQQ